MAKTFTIDNYIPTAAEVREFRNETLLATDWIVVMHTEKGAPIPQEWLDYRQALRDIPSQTGFPTEEDQPVPISLVFPTEPE